MPRRRFLEDLLRYSLLILLSIVLLMPFIWMISTSLKSRVITYVVPPVWLFVPTLENYTELLLVFPFPRYISNSIMVAVLTTAISLFVGSLAAYSFARFKFRGREDLSFMIFTNRLFPPIVSLIPFFLVIRNLGLWDTWTGVALADAFFNLPLVIWLMRSFFEEIPVEIEEAALIDGCSRISTFFRIVVPAAATALAATGVLVFIASWNEFLFALILTGENAKTAPVSMSAMITTRAIRWGEFAAAGTLVVLPVVIFSFLVQRYLVRGLTFGAVKG